MLCELVRITRRIQMKRTRNVFHSSGNQFLAASVAKATLAKRRSNSRYWPNASNARRTQAVFVIQHGRSGARLVPLLHYLRIGHGCSKTSRVHKNLTIHILRVIKEAMRLGPISGRPICIENDKPRQPLIVEARSNLGIVAVRGDGINPRLRGVLEQHLLRSTSSAVSFHAW